MNVCACSRFGTGCTRSSKGPFTTGHGAKIRTLVVRHLLDGDPLLLDGEPVTDVWAVVRELGLESSVNSALDVQAASRALAAYRATRAEFRTIPREQGLARARDTRLRREADRRLARLQADAAREQLIQAARSQTAEWLGPNPWGVDDDGNPLPPAFA